MKKTTKITLSVALLLIVGGPLGYWAYAMSQPGKYDALAACVAESDAKFYGTFWCPYCNEQKRLFGRSSDLLPYVECSPPNRQGQYEVCTEAGVTLYPTWTFADGTTQEGVLTPEELAERTSCTLPE